MWHNMTGLEPERPTVIILFFWAQVMALKLSSAVGAAAAPGPMLPDIPGMLGRQYYLARPLFKGPLGVPLTVYPWYLLCTIRDFT